MDFLLNPNVAYLILLGGVLLTMLALASPGTGLLEIGALFCIVLAGYAVYNLSFNWWAIILVGVSLIPFLYAIQKPNREPFLVLAILLVIVGSVFLFSRDGWLPVVNPILAVFASALVAGFMWFAVQKSIQASSRRPDHDLNALVGQIGEARTKIQDDGSVQVAGELWSARSDESISAGSHIRVVRREGFILVVEKMQSPKNQS
jgi:membrane-bound serine protease (ClpP class)